MLKIFPAHVVKIWKNKKCGNVCAVVKETEFKFLFQRKQRGEKLSSSDSHCFNYLVFFYTILNYVYRRVKLYDNYNSHKNIHTFTLYYVLQIVTAPENSLQ